jgi:hypothetical protein
MTTVSITFVCPAPLRFAGNQMMMVLQEGLGDGNTFATPSRVDADENEYSVARFDVSPEWLIAMQAPMVRPEWDTEDHIDMAAAATAQASLVFWDGTGPHPMPSASTIVATLYTPALEALTVMGLTEPEI